MYFDVIIIGAGPSGLMCAQTLSSKKVLLIDSNEEIGGKIKVSGGGRCNVTNTKTLDELLATVNTNSKFLYPALNKFSNLDLLHFLQKNGVELKEEDNKRVFPKSNSSKTIINFFKDRLHNCEILLNTTVQNIKKEDELFVVDETYYAKELVIATGGITYQHLGTKGFGYEVAKNFGHKLVATYPCESPLISNDELIKSKIFQGITLLDCEMEVLVNGKKKKTFQQNLLFTHFGLSGPAALWASSFIKRQLLNGKKVDVRINLEKIENLPKKITKLDFEELVINIVDVKGYNTAFLTGGGVSTKDIDPKTYMSKKIENLYFIGEVLDINAQTGGNNIAIFMSQGYSCANSINKK